MEFSLKGYIKQGYYVVQKLVGASTKLVYKGALRVQCFFLPVNMNLPYSHDHDGDGGGLPSLCVIVTHPPLPLPNITL